MFMARGWKILVLGTFRLVSILTRVGASIALVVVTGVLVVTLLFWNIIPVPGRSRVQTCIRLLLLLASLRTRM